MNFGQIFSILRARWKIASVVFFVTVVTAVAVSLVLPKTYTATASVVIDVKPDPVTAMIYPGAGNPSFMATQIDVIRSERVARKVVETLKLAENPQIREQWQEETKAAVDIVVWLGASLQRNMEVLPSRESNVIMVSYKAQDPKFASGLANAFVKAYLETTVELRVDPARQYSSFFESRAKELRDALEKAQSKLSEFQRDKGIIATDERLDVENSRLNELSSQLVALQAVSAESGSRKNQAMGDSAERIQEVLQNSVISGLKVDITRSEARLKELSSRLGDNHPQVLETKASISELRARMEAEIKRVTGGVVVTNAINQQRVAEVKASLDAQRVKLLQMKAVRDEGAVLLRDAESAQRAYDQVLARLNQSSLESQATQSNVSVLNLATPPLDASSPRVFLNTLLSIFVGAVLALGLVLVMELRDRRVRTVDDILTTLDMPVLGVLPGPDAKRIFGKSQLALTHARLIGGQSSETKAS